MSHCDGYGPAPVKHQPVVLELWRNVNTYFLSTMRTLIPACARAFAHMRPAGPAPMMRTSTKLSGGSGRAMAGAGIDVGALEAPQLKMGIFIWHFINSKIARSDHPQSSDLR